MLEQERIVLSSSISPLNNKKNVISPITSMSTEFPPKAANVNSNTIGIVSGSKKGHNRSNSHPNPIVTNTMAMAMAYEQQQLGSAIPFVRSQTAPHEEMLVPKQEGSQQIYPSQSGSENDNNNDWSLHHSSPPRPKKQLQPNSSDPDSEEQKLFEQRLCEDIYGVAVRKINQNGKSNLRYVRCFYADAPEVLNFDEPSSNAPQHGDFPSSKSVSSKHSRGSRVGLPRFLGGGGVSTHNRTSYSSSRDQDVHRSLLTEIDNSNKDNTAIDNNSIHSDSKNNKLKSKNTPNRIGKIRVLSWGKKKEVMVPLDKFTAVKKGKVNHRSKRNICDASRIVSLVTYDLRSETKNNKINNFVSLDIEAPTRLDRDKFAKAFARFLKIPLIEEGDITPQSHVSTAFPHQQYNHRPLSSPQPGGSVSRSIKSDMTPLSWKDPNRQSTTSSVANDLSIPDIALTTSNSQTTNEKNARSSSSNWRELIAPLPVVTTSRRGISSPSRSGSGKNTNIATKPPRISRRSTTSINSAGGGFQPPTHPGINVNAYSNSKIHFSNHLNGSISSRTGSEVDDPPLASLPSSCPSNGASNINSTSFHNTNTASASNKLHLHTIINSSMPKKEKMVLEIPNTSNSKLPKYSNSNSNHVSSTPATSAISAPFHTSITIPDTPATDTATSDSNINNVSAITSAGDSDDIDMDSDNDNDGSIVSSITGVGFDQDLVEELHLALERMKVELEESRAEASRAVKVAEQAIQSAENSSSKDWNNTVTHKAAEAAATAQKKSAEAMAKARVAEERLSLERKGAVLRKKQVEQAEQQAAHWQTRAAAAEVQRFAVAEALDGERKKNQNLVLQAEQAVATAASLKSKSRKTNLFKSNNKASSLSKTKTAISTELVEVDRLMESVEVDRLRSKLAMESHRRRKLLDELQDLRGVIRVYCRLNPPSLATATAAATAYPQKPAVIDMVSNEVLMVHRDKSSSSTSASTSLQPHKSASSSSSPSTPLCFEFDGILASDMGQQDVYAEFEAICASVVEGFKICVMSYGQADSGKTHTMLGDVLCHKGKSARHSVSIENEGIHLRAMQQLFSLLERRKDQFQDAVTMNLVEVHDERLSDLLAGTEFGEKHGKVETRKSSRRTEKEKMTAAAATAASADDAKTPPRSVELRPKLELKTNRDGETVVRGVLNVDLASYDDVLRIWTESLAQRSTRLAEQATEDPLAYELNSHVVATLKVVSTNRSTGSIASGRMQFVDFASSDITPRRTLGSSGVVSSFLSSSSVQRILSSTAASKSLSDQLLEDWKFTNRSLNTVREVVLARSQFQRSVPYRNSTITHILSDSLEADTKVVLIACVSSDPEDLANTACTLQLAQEMRKVVVGKATRHTSISAAGSSSNNNNNNNSSNSNNNNNNKSEI